jgi:hypothetical protein
MSTPSSPSSYFSPPLLVFYDLETTGLDVDKDLILEIGAICPYSRHWNPHRAPAKKEDENPAMFPRFRQVCIPPQELVEARGIDLTKIFTPLLREQVNRDTLVNDCFRTYHNRTPSTKESLCDFFEWLRSLVRATQTSRLVLIAHNGEKFDKPMLLQNVDSTGVCLVDRVLLSHITFADSLPVIQQYLKRSNGNSLTKLKQEYLKPDDPLRTDDTLAHEALADVCSLIQVLENMGVKREDFL